jgi:rhodanese-related sulfurtransferase
LRRKHVDLASKILIGMFAAYVFFKLFGYLNRLGIKQLSPRDLDQKKGITLLDVRTDREYATGHIPGSVHVPLTEVAAKVKKLRKEKEIVVYCQHGNRSIWAIKRLISMGYKNLYNLRGGYNAWKRFH